jgi:hypothetical protein
MRLTAQQNFRTETNWRELLDRNEKLATEVGRLRAAISNLKKKNSTLLLWKLNVEPKTLSTRPRQFDKSTQTELLSISNPFQTPLRSRSVSQNSAVKDANDNIFSENVFDTRKLNSNSNVSHLFSVEDTKATYESKPKTKTQRRKSGLLNSPRHYISPTESQLTQNMKDRIIKEMQSHEHSQLNDENAGIFPTSGVDLNSTVKSTKRKSTSSIKNENLTTPDRPSRTVKKVVTYKEPSLRVKVRKGFQFFKFADTPAAKNIDEQELSEENAEENNYATSAVSQFFDLMSSWQEEEKDA